MWDHTAICTAVDDIDHSDRVFARWSNSTDAGAPMSMPDFPFEDALATALAAILPPPPPGVDAIGRPEPF